MTVEKGNPDIQSRASSEPHEPAAKSRTAQAATVQAASDNEQVTRSKRKARAESGQTEDTTQLTRTKRKETSQTEETTETKPVRWVQVRILPIYVRVILVILLLAVAAVIGALIGYSVLGDGTASGIFQKDTWMHIFDIMNGKEK
ncbi:DNA-directed RNA polymerase subunit beta [Sporosarcina gallistercoris]|uniref:DNA-directed RNA polymerase subunit beta n=1 Tax=Sporosarcina gallistercoris TaxID=2762245 RepID=UPI003D27032A